MEQNDLMPYMLYHALRKDDGKSADSPLQKKRRRTDSHLIDRLADAVDLISSLAEILEALFSV